MNSVTEFVKSEAQGCSKLLNNLICDICDKQEVTINDLFDALVPCAVFIFIQSLAIYGLYGLYDHIRSSTMTPFIFLIGLLGLLCECGCALWYISFFQWVNKKFTRSVGKIKIAKRR